MLQEGRDILVALEGPCSSVQVLRGDGAQQPYRGRVFLGADGAPITFQVRPQDTYEHASCNLFPVPRQILMSVPTTSWPTVQSSSCGLAMCCRMESA